MYCFQSAGVRFDARTKISIDPRLTSINDVKLSVGATHVGHYSYDDYSRMQRLKLSDLADAYNVQDTEGRSRDERESHPQRGNLSDIRSEVWFRNSKYEGEPDPDINPGYRALYSLQLVNGDPTLSALTNISNMRSVSPSDVSVFDSETGEIYDQNYYEAQERTKRSSTEYVEPHLMGSLGDAMTVLNED